MQCESEHAEPQTTDPYAVFFGQLTKRGLLMIWHLQLDSHLWQQRGMNLGQTADHDYTLSALNNAILVCGVGVMDLVLTINWAHQSEVEAN